MDVYFTKLNRKGSGALVDLLVISGVAFLVFAISATFDVFGWLVRLVVEDNVRIAEILIVLPFLGLALGAFSARRWKELRDEVAERQQAEEALRQSEAQFRGIFEGAAFGVALVDKEGRVIESNPALQRMLGYSRDELHSLSFLAFTHPDDVARDMALFQEIVVGLRDYYQVEKRYLHKDGQQLWGRLTCSVVRDDAGGPRFAFGMVEDITARKRAEDALRESEVRQDIILRSLPMVLYTLRAPGQLDATWISEQVDRVTGFPRSAFLEGQDIWPSRLHPEDRDRVLRELASIAETGSLATEYRWQCADGTYHWFLDRAVLVRDDHGRPGEIVGTWLDISEERQAEEIRARLIAILEATSDFVGTTTVDGRVLYPNKAARAMLGLGEDVDVSTFTIPDNHPRWATAVITEEGIPTALRDGIWSGETAILHRDGREIPISQVILAHRAPDGTVKFLSTISRDITERKQYEQQLTYLATHDPLTGLPNRRSLEEALNRAIARARRGIPSTLLFIDLDDFKLVNDSLGHAAGDRALVALARLIQGQLRAEDMLIRLGGDEFAVLLEGTDVANGRLVAERMRRAIEESPLTLMDTTFQLSLSIGLADIDGEQPDTSLLARADVAMFRAKAQGGNRIEC